MLNHLYVNSFDKKDVALAREFGLGLEVEDYLWMYTSEQIEEKNRLASEMIKGFSKLSFHGTAINRDLNEISQIPDERLTEIYNESCQYAMVHGITKIVFHSNYSPEIHSADAGEWIVKNARFWREFIKDKPSDLQIYIENLADDTPEILLHLIDEIDNPNIKVCLDTGHAHCHFEMPVQDWIKTLNHRIGHVHLHNNDGIADKHWAISRGTIDFHDVFSCFEKYTHNVCFVLECGLEDSLSWLRMNEYI